MNFLGENFRLGTREDKLKKQSGLGLMDLILRVRTPTTHFFQLSIKPEEEFSAPPDLFIWFIYRLSYFNHSCQTLWFCFWQMLPHLTTKCN